MKLLTRLSASLVQVILISLFCNFSPIKAQENCSVTFIVTAQTVKAGEHVFIAGNLAQLGGWNPGKIQLDSAGNSVYRITVPVPQHKQIEYKFTKGSWNNQAIFELGRIPENFWADIESDTTFRCTIPYWQEGKITTVGQVTGTLKYHRNMTGDGIKPRDISVWLPPDYDKNPTQRYPVLYMHDGQNLFDPETSSFGHDWELDERADSLIRASAIEPMIIVGIYNTPDRGEEYSYGRLGKLYAKFVVHRLKPFIDSVYRTKPDRDNTANGGSSSGGLISFIMLWNYPDVFSRAACFSPAFFPEYDSLVRSGPAINHSSLFYIDIGGKGVDVILLPGVMKMLDILKEKGFEIGKNVMWVNDPSADHNEQAWAKRIANPLLFFYKK